MTTYAELLQEGYVHNLMLASNRRELQRTIRAAVHSAEERLQQRLLNAAQGLSEADITRIRRGVYRGTARLESFAERLNQLTDEVSDELRTELINAARDLAMYEAMFWQDRYARLAQDDESLDGIVNTGEAVVRQARTNVTRNALVFGTIAASVVQYRNSRRTRLRRNITSAAQSEGLTGIVGLFTVSRAARRVGRLFGETTRSINIFTGDVHTHASAVGAQTFADSNPAFDLVWTSIIDERTSSICLTRNGQFVNRDLDGLVPPGHFGCRSIVVPAILEDNLTQGQLNRLRPDTRRAVERGLPNFNSTDDSFNQLNPAQQRQLLGATRFRIFEAGELSSVREFIGGDEDFVSLEQLAKRENIDLSEFRGRRD